MGPCILELRRDLWNGSESKVFMDACLVKLKVILFLGRLSEEEFQSLDAIRINELANALVRLVSNLSA